MAQISLTKDEARYLFFAIANTEFVRTQKEVMLQRRILAKLQTAKPEFRR